MCSCGRNVFKLLTSSIRIFQSPTAQKYVTIAKCSPSGSAFREFEFGNPIKSSALIFTRSLSTGNLAKLKTTGEHSISQSSALQGIHDSISSLQVKKRAIRKKKPAEIKVPGIYNVVAYATAEEYDLEKLEEGLRNQELYQPQAIDNSPDVLHAVAKYQVDKEPREIFFFREGSVILWNVTDLEINNVLVFLRKFESDSYSDYLVQEECEVMNYKYQEEGKPSSLEKNGDFMLSRDPEKQTLDKYTFSNALVLSVKLGVWEASLDKYIDSIEFVTEDLKRGKKIKMSREEVLRKHGELFALRHLINLSSDLLDTPDFYWENDHLENLYLQLCSYFNISKRTKVMNEKINHCVELIELLSTHLSDKHHIRLEWMIIVLIMVEVGFETIHYIDRFVLH